ncbi:ribonuclease P protein subunit Rpp14 [Halovenus aranensis]|jgi:ribonuclease P/MRP protein subunit POP5|uniref:Ribonuclease P protein component 2 n=1 Tax=Halovenus aranensis TaxID=890420 RepID=A0A1G8TQP8_9EURY|nr:Rpp14/Pop5 family protein [Halovenus aranensis]SDJ43818.1 ribonuclease P protein subunit Rpp14 [Halovenus aranensis]
MKHLPKHLQPRWRYLAVVIETWANETVTRDGFQRALWYSAQNLLGDTGSAALDLSVLRFEHADGDGEAVVRVRRGGVDRARAVVACLDSVEGSQVGVHVRGTSGTVRACEEKYMGRGPIEPKQRHVVFEGAERSVVVRNGRIDIETEDGPVGATNLDTE